MEKEYIIWIIAFFAGLFLFSYGIINIIVQKGKKEDSFAKSTLIEFFACWVLFVPNVYYNELPNNGFLLKLIETIITSLLRTFNIYFGNGYERIEIEGHNRFTICYTVLMAMVNISILIFIAGLILKFFEGPFQKLKIMFKKRKYTYIFSSCDAKNIAIAKSINNPDANIVFACSEIEVGTKEKEDINSINGIVVGVTVREVLKRFKNKSFGIEIFLFGETEEENLADLDEVCAELENGKNNQVKIYVELYDTPWDLYNDISKNNGNENIIINFVRSEENFVYNNLLKNSIFDNAIDNGKCKDINILIAGMNCRNAEMLKAVLHLSQMPGYNLNVMVLDEHNQKGMIKRMMPEIYEECNVVGDAVYKLIYKENIDFTSDELEKILEEEYRDFTFAFVNAGEDLKNFNIAMRINSFCYRHNRKDYKIQVNIKNKNMCDRWNKLLVRDLDIVGDFESVYNYNFITMSDIERVTIKIHNVRYPQDNPKSPTWESYCNNEYNRHSVYARTLSFKYKVELIDKFYNSDYTTTGRDKVWKIYEHMRWNVYTRTMGYTKADKALLTDGKVSKEIRNIAKVHNDLVPFEELSKEEQKKDALKLTDDIVKALKDI